MLRIRQTFNVLFAIAAAGSTFVVSVLAVETLPITEPISEDAGVSILASADETLPLTGVPEKQAESTEMEGFS